MKSTIRKVNSSLISNSTKEVDFGDPFKNNLITMDNSVGEHEDKRMKVRNNGRDLMIR